MIWGLLLLLLLLLSLGCFCGGVFFCFYKYVLKRTDLDEETEYQQELEDILVKYNEEEESKEQKKNTKKMKESRNKKKSESDVQDVQMKESRFDHLASGGSKVNRAEKKRNEGQALEEPLIERNYHEPELRESKKVTFKSDDSPNKNKRIIETEDNLAAQKKKKIIKKVIKNVKTGTRE